MVCSSIGIVTLMDIDDVLVVVGFAVVFVVGFVVGFVVRSVLYFCNKRLVISLKKLSSLFACLVVNA
jgi:uncharacterized membrane protein YciS (DUF1049 family)